MRRRILIVTNRSDFTADVVIKRLHDRRIGFARFNTEDFPLKTHGEIFISNETEFVRLRNEKWALDQESVQSVWYRRPVLPDIEGACLSSDDKAFAARESLEFVQSLWRLLSDRLWITQPDVLRRVETKALQLRTAAEAGFEIPDTLISNDASEIKEFYRGHRRNVVVKPLTHGGYGNSQDTVIYASNLDSRFDENAFNSSHLSPFMIQEKIEKRFDVRLTAFGGHYFSHSIAVTGTGNILDWRKCHPDALRYAVIETPKEVRQAVSRFMSICEISFGAFDFACLDDGRWVFLEVNPNGQWAWLELATGIPMSDTLIDLLMGLDNGDI